MILETGIVTKQFLSMDSREREQGEIVLDDADEDSGTGSDCSVEISRNCGTVRRPRNSFSRRSAMSISTNPDTLETMESKIRIDSSHKNGTGFRHDFLSMRLDSVPFHRAKDSRYSDSTPTLNCCIKENHPEVEKEMRAKFLRSKGCSIPVDLEDLLLVTNTSRLSRKSISPTAAVDEMSFRNSMYSFHPEVARIFENDIHKKIDLDYTGDDVPPPFYERSEHILAKTATHDQRVHSTFSREANFREAVGDRRFEQDGAARPRAAPEFRWQQLLLPSQRP